MALTIANNVGALNARNNLNRSQAKLERSIERLSTGLKINRGADGPAALVISEKQRSQIAGLRTAIDNTRKGVAVVQTAEGALNEINSILITVRSLALDSANSGVNDADALAANQAEINGALDTITRIAENTQFGEKQLLQGSAGISGTASDADVTFLRGSGSTSDGTYTIDVTTAAERANIVAGTAQTTTLAANEVLFINGVSINLNLGLDQNGVVARINEFTDQTGVMADISGGATRLYSLQYGSNAEISVASDTVAAVDSSGFGTTQITDIGLNIAGEIDGIPASGNGNVLTSIAGASTGAVVRIAESAADPVLSESGLQGTISPQNNALVFQIGPNQNQTAQIAIQSVRADALALNTTGSVFTSLDEIDVTSFKNAQDSLTVIDAAIDELSSIRGELGAFQASTLESVANNMLSTLENTVNAESVIRDTDFAEEVSTFTNSQILVEAGTSVLSSANQTTQAILALLQ